MSRSVNLRRALPLDATVRGTDYSVGSRIASRSSDARSPLAALIAAELSITVDEVARALRAIDPRNAHAILRKSEGMSTRDAAAEAGCSEATYRGRVRRAVVQLLRWFRGERPSKLARWCHVHASDGEFRSWRPKNGRPARRWYCATCRAEKRSVGRRRTSCGRCGQFRYLKLRKHSKSGKSWLECGFCRAAYMREHMRARRARAKALAVGAA